MSVKETRAGKIREWLLSQDGPRLAGEISAAIGMPGDERVSFSLNVMRRGGIIGRVGSGKSMRYFVVRGPLIQHGVRKPKDRKASAALRAEVKAAQAEVVKRKKKLWQAKEARAAAKRQANNAALAVRAEEVSRREAARKVQPSCAKRIPNAPKVERVESVADFLARGGQVERLPVKWGQAA